MKVWITKYALTRGVMQINAMVVPRSSKTYVRGKLANGAPIFTREWYGTAGEALRVAEQMRLAKIASLKRQIARLEAPDMGRIKR